jgi:phosphopantetheine--protein transferase-like protein
MTDKDKVYVYISRVPAVLPRKALFPPARLAEIMSCKSDSLGRQKYRAWELLEQAFRQVFLKNLTELGLRKTDTGKWVSDKGFYFSISHCESLVAVAVSSAPVGVDIEEMRAIKAGFEKKCLSKEGLAEFGELDEDERGRYLLRRWTVKESIFKLSDEGIFRPPYISGEGFYTESREFELEGKSYIISASLNRPIPIIFNLKDFLE